MYPFPDMKAIFLVLLVALMASPANAQTPQEKAYVAERERLVADLEAKRKSLPLPIDESAWRREEARVHEMLKERLQAVIGPAPLPQGFTVSRSNPDPVCCGAGAGSLDALAISKDKLRAVMTTEGILKLWLGHDPRTALQGDDIDYYRALNTDAPVDIFAALPPPTLERLAASLIEVRFPAGATVIQKGDAGDRFYVVGEGEVEIEGTVFGPGSSFGEIALLDGNPRTADATAVTDCELFVIERRDFLPLVGEEPEIALRIIEILCSKLRRTTEQAGELMFLDLPSRLAKALMRLVDADTAGLRERKISITQKDLGNIIGMSRESTNKQLRDWEERKWIALERGAVLILQPAALATVADASAD